MDLSSYFMPYRMVGVEKEVPVFSLRDINLYGKPDLFGVYEYLVLDDPTESCPYVMDYAMERERSGRPIHRYSQTKRFEALVRKFMGGRCKFGAKDCLREDILFVVDMECSREPELIWNSIRKILKRNGWSRYYDNISSIIEMLGYDKKIVYPKEILENIYDDFRTLTYLYSKMALDRKYMINFRFVALKLMERHGVVFEYLIPKLQTKSKVEEFELIWAVLESFLN